MFFAADNLRDFVRVGVGVLEHAQPELRQQQTAAAILQVGGTVLLSSHLLTEVQVIADEIVMIGRGRIVAQGTTTDLVGARGTRVGAVDAAALDALATALRARDLGVTSSAGVLLVNAAPEVIGAVALEERVVLTELSAGGAGSLEEMFLELTAATSREGAAA